MGVPRRILFSAAMVGLATLGATARAEVIYVDNLDADFSGTWVDSTSADGYFGSNYQHNNAVAGPTGIYTPDLPTAGTWSVWARWTSDANRSGSVPYTINYDGGSQTIFVNQQVNGSAWQKLGEFSFAAGTGGNVLLDTAGTTGYVIADAIAFSDLEAINSASLQAYASSYIITDDRAPVRAVDGSGLNGEFPPALVGTVNGKNINWLSAKDDPTGWLKVDLGATYDLESMDVYNFISTSTDTNKRGVKTFDLYVSTAENPTSDDFANSAEWTLVLADVELGKAPASFNDQPDLVSFAEGGTAARWVALDITSNYGDPDYTGLGEIRFYEAVPEPTGLAVLATTAALTLTRRRRRRLK